MPLSGAPRVQNRVSAPRTRWLQAGKALLAVGILGFLLTQVETERLWGAIRSSLGGWLGLAFLLNSSLLISSTWKWDRLLRAVGVVRDFGALLRLYTIGFFFSSFLPGTVGGDVVRWHAASSAPELRVRVAATILAERITGVVALVVLGVSLLAWERERLATPPVLILLASLAALVFLAVWLARDPRLANLLLRGSGGRGAWILSPLHRLHGALSAVPIRALVASVGYSMPFYLLAGIVFYLISRAFGADIGLREAVTVQTLTCVLTLLPISIGGLGLAQAGDVYLLGLLGVAAPTALGMSLLRQALSYAYAALGALLFVRWSGRPSVSELRSAGARRASRPQTDAGT